MVINSVEDESGMNFVDVTSLAEGGLSFKVSRNDPEDEGRWTLVTDYSGLHFDTEHEALRNAAVKIPWLAEARVSTSPAYHKNIDDQKT